MVEHQLILYQKWFSVGYQNISLRYEDRYNINNVATILFSMMVSISPVRNGPVLEIIGCVLMTDMQTPPLKSVPYQKVIMNGAECSE